MKLPVSEAETHVVGVSLRAEPPLQLSGLLTPAKFAPSGNSSKSLSPNTFFKVLKAGTAYA